MNMPDPITLAIASAAAGKAAEAMSDQAKETVAAIVKCIREKLRHQPAELTILDAAKDNPSRIEELAIILDEASAGDVEFGTRLRMLWNQAGLAAGEGGVVNAFHGTAGKVIQLRDVHGDINIG